MTAKKKFWANLSILRSRKGFTLMELMITIALVAILAVGAITVFLTWSDGYMTAKANNEQQMVLDAMIEAVSTELRYATDVTLTTKVGGVDEGVGHGRARIRFQQNQLYISTMGAESVFHTQKHTNSTEPLSTLSPHNMTAYFQYEDAYHITLTITMEDEAGHKMSESSTIKLLNCELKNDPVTVYSGTGAPVVPATPHTVDYFAVMYVPAFNLNTP